MTLNDIRNTLMKKTKAEVSMAVREVFFDGQRKTMRLSTNLIDSDQFSIAMDIYPRKVPR